MFLNVFGMYSMCTYVDKHTDTYCTYTYYVNVCIHVPYVHTMCIYVDIYIYLFM